MRVFISQPMAGKTYEEILSERNRAIALLKDMVGNFELIDNATPRWYLGKSIDFLLDADLAYFIKGWENARGCKIEHLCAISYGIEVIEE